MFLALNYFPRSGYSSYGRVSRSFFSDFGNMVSQLDHVLRGELARLQGSRCNTDLGLSTN